MVVLILKENSEKAFINTIKNIIRKLCHEDLQMAKVMQRFEETGWSNTSSMRPVNLNKLILNTFKKIWTQAHT